VRTLDIADVGGQSRAIVTGGAGFIGSHLVDALVARSAEVHVVDNLASGSRENLPAEAELHELDIRDEALEELAAHQVCARAAGVELQPRFAPERPGDLRRSILDVSLAEEALGWRAETQLEDGVARTWDVVNGEGPARAGPSQCS